MGEKEKIFWRVCLKKMTRLENKGRDDTKECRRRGPVLILYFGRGGQLKGGNLDAEIGSGGGAKTPGRGAAKFP